MFFGKIKQVVSELSKNTSFLFPSPFDTESQILSILRKKLKDLKNIMEK